MMKEKNKLQIMKKILLFIIIILLCSCNSSVQNVVFLNSHPSDYVYKVESSGKVYYTNEYTQTSMTCINFIAQDNQPQKICGSYTITLLKF